MASSEIVQEGEARLIKDRLPNFRGHAQLWRVHPPLKRYSWSDEEADAYEYVVVSGARVSFSGPETYIFGADSKGKVLNWGELPGSFKGAIDHERALRGAGYDTLIYESKSE